MSVIYTKKKSVTESMNWFSIVTEQFWLDYNDLDDKQRSI